MQVRRLLQRYKGRFRRPLLGHYNWLMINPVKIAVVLGRLGSLYIAITTSR
jgi:ABC-type polysaccharide/polyol phosphate export permease